MMSDNPVREALNRAADEVTPEDIDEIIKYLRKHRAHIAAGGKAKKEKEDVDIAKLLPNVPELQPVRNVKARRF
jgi:phage terminase Nu1 subunit (DNA packaging protein)